MTSSQIIIPRRKATRRRRRTLSWKHVSKRVHQYHHIYVY